MLYIGNELKIQENNEKLFKKKKYKKKTTKKPLVSYARNFQDKWSYKGGDCGNLPALERERERERERQLLLIDIKIMAAK